MNMKRRTILFGAGGFFAFAAATGTRWLSDPRKAYVISILQKELDYANFSVESADQFADDIIKYDPGMASSRARSVAFFGTSLTPALARLLGLRLGERIIQKEKRIAAKFLLSTDFFDLIDKTDDLIYIGYADPYVIGCANSLATAA